MLELLERLDDVLEYDTDTLSHDEGENVIQEVNAEITAMLIQAKFHYAGHVTTPGCQLAYVFKMMIMKKPLGMILQ
jgi:hypothetical protein